MLDEASNERQTSQAEMRPSLAAMFRELGVQTDSHWDDDTFSRVVRGLVRQLGVSSVLEIGGGRDPLFKPDDLPSLNIDLTVNDISQPELDRLPGIYQRACFDVGGDDADIARLGNTFDLIFSHTVLEHVADGRQAWRNMCAMLKSGGVALAFVPTLYSLPFVLNRLLPDELARWIVRALYRHRTDADDPIFPARYSWTFASEAKMRPMLEAAGFSEALILPFYGHGYFERFPLVRSMHRSITELARRNDWRLIASYAYIVARK